MRVAKATRIWSGRAMKNTWKVGISRLSTPMPRYISRLTRSSGAAIRRPTANA